MATETEPVLRLSNGYPTSDGKPMAETDWHRILMNILIEVLKEFYRSQPDVYVSGNLMLFYEKGNRRKHVSPDVFVVKGVPKGLRPNYLLWEEKRSPQVVIELTSKTTRKEDLNTKKTLYRDVLQVREYFLFDPESDYLDPPLQGFRLRKGEYRAIKQVNGRLPSQGLGLHLERDGNMLRLWNPQTGQWLPSPEEARQAAEQRIAQLEQALQQALDQLEHLSAGGEEGS